MPKPNSTSAHTPSSSPIRVTRSVDIPDQLRLTRYQKAPEYGPRILFFSGGTALNSLSRRLVNYTHNSIHITTPFDSGGSSGKLRGPFDVMAVGDMRSRLMALADRSVKGQKHVFELFTFRLPTDASPAALRERLKHMVDGDHPLVARIVKPMRDLIRNHLGFFMEAMPADFDLRGASIGNLVLVGGFVNNQRDIESVIFLFSKLVEVRGTVRPVLPGSYHLAVELEDGTELVGQHIFAGKESPAIQSPIKRIRVIKGLDNTTTVDVQADDFANSLIGKAELICYPMGSFYSSVVANLLARGVGRAVAANDCPKVYIPNTGTDPEQFGMTTADCVRRLLEYLRVDCGEEIETNRLLQFVVLDAGQLEAQSQADLDAIRAFGIQIIAADLVSDRSAPYLDEEKLIATLLSLT